MNVNEVIYIQYKFKWRQEHKLEKKKMINDVEIGTRTEIGTGTERSVTIIFFRLKTCRATLFVSEHLSLKSAITEVAIT